MIFQFCIQAELRQGEEGHVALQAGGDGRGQSQRFGKLQNAKDASRGTVLVLIVTFD
jgi:hypothetical protein